MEYCAGDSLKKRIRNGSSNPEDKLVYEWLWQIADAINYLHSNDIIHLGLKLDKLVFFSSFF